MISGLDKDGKLIPPGDAATAARRLRECRVEVDRMLRELLYVTPSQDQSYVAWRWRAIEALERFRSEERQLADWLASQHLDQLQAVHGMVAGMQLEGVDLEPPETEIMERCEKHLGSFQQPKQDKRSQAT